MAEMDTSAPLCFPSQHVACESRRCEGKRIIIRKNALLLGGASIPVSIQTDLLPQLVHLGRKYLQVQLESSHATCR